MDKSETKMYTMGRELGGSSGWGKQRIKKNVHQILKSRGAHFKGKDDNIFITSI